MKNKNLETILYSTIGVLALFIIILAFNFITAAVKKRVDLTAEKAYTLSPGTKAILNKLDTKVTIRFYCSQGDEMPVFFKTYGRRIEDLLTEYKQAGKGKIIVEKYNLSVSSSVCSTKRRRFHSSRPTANVFWNMIFLVPFHESSRRRNLLSV
jgi:ABC-type uncharacterized transport system involved in gliding motility auxiliary subunit